MAYRTTNPNDFRMDEACIKFLESLGNKRNTDHHMWPKYVGMGYAFVLGNTGDAKNGHPHSRLNDLIERYWVYPPGGAEGRKASYKTMNH